MYCFSTSLIDGNGNILKTLFYDWSNIMCGCGCGCDDKKKKDKPAEKPAEPKKPAKEKK